MRGSLVLLRSLEDGRAEGIYEGVAWMCVHSPIGKEELG